MMIPTNPRNRPHLTIGEASLVAVIAFSLILLLSAFGMLLTGGENGEWSGWVGAVSTALAFAAAAIAAIYAARAFHLETERDNRQHETQARAQAERVAIWAENDGSVLARNASTTPVYGISIGVQLDPMPAEPFWDESEDMVMPPSDQPREVGLPNQLRAIWSRRGYRDEGWCIRFTDAAGQRWYRDGRGQLVHLNDEAL